MHRVERLQQQTGRSGFCFAREHTVSPKELGALPLVFRRTRMRWTEWCEGQSTGKD